MCAILIFLQITFCPACLHASRPAPFGACNRLIRNWDPFTRLLARTLAERGPGEAGEGPGDRHPDAGLASDACRKPTSPKSVSGCLCWSGYDVTMRISAKSAYDIDSAHHHRLLPSAVFTQWTAGCCSAGIEPGQDVEDQNRRHRFNPAVRQDPVAFRAGLLPDVRQGDCEDR